MLEIKHVGKCYKDKLVINDASFTINDGEIVSILGDNGSGKTTTIKLIAGLLEKDKGEILLNGKPIKLNDIGYLPEERSLYYDCSIYEQLKLLAKLAKIEEYDTIIEYYLNRVNLLDRKDSLICELSKGNQQKVAFVSALLKGPKILLLDEPFTGLDKDNIKLFERMILEYITSKRIVIISSHIYDPINRYCDRFIAIKDGEIKLNVTKKEMIEDERRVIVTSSDKELKNYIELSKEETTCKYIYENDHIAHKAIRWMINNNFTDYTFRHLNIEDLIE